MRSADTVYLNTNIPQIEEVSLAHALSPLNSSDPRGADWINKELKERGWSRAQFEVKEGEYQEELRGRTIAAGGY